MAERDAGSVRVQPVVERVDLPLGQHRKHLRGERLVEFNEVDIVQREPGTLQRGGAWRSRDRYP